MPSLVIYDVLIAYSRPVSPSASIDALEFAVPGCGTFAFGGCVGGPIADVANFGTEQPAITMPDGLSFLFVEGVFLRICSMFG